MRNWLHGCVLSCSIESACHVIVQLCEVGYEKTSELGSEVCDVCKLGPVGN